MNWNWTKSCAAIFLAVVFTVFGTGSSVAGPPGPRIVGTATQPPTTLDAVYVNGLPTAVTYGGGTLPRPFIMQAIRFRVRTAGSVGTTNAVFRATDGASNCDCAYACNQGTGPKRVTCTATTGTCQLLATAVTYSYTSAGDCAGTTADIQGNISVEGIWP